MLREHLEAKYMETKHGPAKDYTHRQVTKDELINALMAMGMTKDKAGLQATAAKVFGSRVLVGKEWLSVG